MSMYDCKPERLSGINVRRYANDVLKELFRKSIHICAAFVPLLLKHFYLLTLSLLLFAIFLYLICESLRFCGKNVPIISTITQTAARKRDQDKFVLGPITLALGIFTTACIFDPKSAAVGIYALALGDGLASLVGKIFGISYLYKMQGKTAEGSLACFAAIFISCFLLTKNSSAALVIAFTGMFVELLPLKDFDNLFIPLLLALVHNIFFL
ncbi:MAG: diacylglycerol/polyprenol kinase family protein [Treponemataceae bacterium]